MHTIYLEFLSHVDGLLIFREIKGSCWSIDVFYVLKFLGRSQSIIIERLIKKVIGDALRPSLAIHHVVTQITILHCILHCSYSIV